MIKINNLNGVLQQENDIFILLKFIFTHNSL